MSRIRANTITNQNANGAPNFPDGITVTGVVTATTTNQNITGDLSVTGNIGVGGTLTYEDVTNIDSVGVITARSGIRIGATGSNTLITGNGNGIGIGITTPQEELHIRAATPVIRLEDGDNARQSQIVGSDGNLRLDADNGNAIANTNIAFRTDGGERLRIGPVGQIGIGGANYGTSGQVLTSQGSGSAVQWATPSSGLSDFDTWYLTQDTVGNTNPVQNHWSRWTNHGGTGSVTFAAPSSGVWTFPSTGYWLIEWYGRFTITNATERGCNASIYVTTNNSYYAFVTQASCNMGASHSSGVKGVARASYIFDVTSVSTHKVKLEAGYQQVTGTLTGHGAYLYSHVKFFKLRDT